MSRSVVRTVEHASAFAARPGKVISATFASRASPASLEPSFLLKPASSVGVPGGEVECPEGVEHLAFEAAIALLIGRDARRVGVDDAWDYVSHFSAGTSYSIHDLGGAASGSTLRSNGRDGYIPLGPSFVDARGVHPEQIRLRSWRNGLLVEGASTPDMHLPVAQVVAHLSQHLTLQVGDVVLVGTSVGTAVAAPGDVVEIEVDAPQASGAPSSGRLISRVVSVPGRVALWPGSTPTISVSQRADPPGSSERTGNLAPGRYQLTPELRAKLLLTPVAGISAQLRKRGINNVTVEGVRSTRPDRKLVGVARTLRFVPNREDLFAIHGGGYNAQKRAFDDVGRGEVIVIEARGEPRSATLGDVLALRAHARGAAGIVTDGGVRDYDAVAAVDLPVFTRGAHPAVLGRMHVPWEVNVAVSCGGTTVQPGDVIVGDSDGVIVIPPALVEEVVDAALAQEEEDSWIAAQVVSGHALDGLFPMNSEWRARFEADRRPADWWMR